MTDISSNVTIKPSPVSGTITAPASKSSMQRACAAALVKKGISYIQNPGISNDDLASLNVIQSLGAQVVRLEDRSLKVDSSHFSDSASLHIHFGESGLGIRMFTPIAALLPQPIDITGEGSLLQRPMAFFDEVLPKLGVKIQSNDGRLPLHIQGPLQTADITIDGSQSSQYLTGLLLAFAAAGASNKTIEVENLKSRPYIDLTLKVMEDFGLPLPENDNYRRFIFRAGSHPENKPVTYAVEGDWSGAAFLLVAGAIAGNITVLGLDTQSTQADKAILQALQASGCRLSVRDREIEVSKVLALKPFRFDASDCPDLFPPLVALAAYCKGDSMIEGVSRLAHKESNRGLALQEEFGKLGIQIELKGDVMIVHGGDKLHGATVFSHNDHRIAMACAVAALQANDAVTVEAAPAVKKSYPNFYEDLFQLKREN